MLDRFSRPGFRRRAFVKRRKFGYRTKFKRRGNYKKRLIGGAARAARSSYTNTPMCRDLGMIWPSCLITKLRQVAYLPADFRSGVQGLITSTTDEGSSYSSFITYWPADVGAAIGPFRACPYSGSTAATAYADKQGFTALAATDALGIDKLLVAAGSSPAAPYSRCCVLSAKYSITFSFFHGTSQTTYIPMPIMPPSRHMLHPMCNKDVVITPVTTNATADAMWNQPDVSRRYLAAATGHAISGSSGTTATDTAIGGRSVRWKGTIWPHKLLDKTFTDYVADDNSFGTSAALPANYVGHQFGGFFSNLGETDNYFAPDRGVMLVNVVYTCLFKDIAGKQS